MRLPIPVPASQTLHLGNNLEAFFGGAKLSHYPKKGSVLI
jgi:hypothetical protein